MLDNEVIDAAAHIFTRFVFVRYGKSECLIEVISDGVVEALRVLMGNETHNSPTSVPGAA